jgi:hypothetical protein
MRAQQKNFTGGLFLRLARTALLNLTIKLIVDGALERGLITKRVEPETLVDFSFAKGL